MASFRKFTNINGDVWEARVTRKGFEPMTKRFISKADADRWARKQETEADTGSLKKPSKATVAAAIDAYIESHSVSEDLKWQLLTVRHDLGSHRTMDLNFRIVAKFLLFLKTMNLPSVKQLKPGVEARTYSASTVRKFYFALKKSVEWHAKVENYPLQNLVFEGHTVPGCWEKPRDRRLLPGEEEALLLACNGARKRKESWKLLIRFALETGMRLQELILSEWKNLSRDGKSLWLPAAITKGKEARDIPLSVRARGIIEELRLLCPPTEIYLFWEFKGTPASCSTLFRKLTARAGSVGLTFHDLRHEALSRICERSDGRLNAIDLMKISGHKELKVLNNYTRLIPSQMADKLG